MNVSFFLAFVLLHTKKEYKHNEKKLDPLYQQTHVPQLDTSQTNMSSTGGKGACINTGNRFCTKQIWRDFKFVAVIAGSVMLINKMYRGSFEGMVVNSTTFTNPIAEAIGLPYDAGPRNTEGFAQSDIKEKERDRNIIK